MFLLAACSQCVLGRDPPTGEQVCAAQGSWAKALELLERLVRTEETQAPERAYAAAVSACAKGAQHDWVRPGPLQPTGLQTVAHVE